MIFFGDLLFAPSIFLLPSPLKPHFLHAPLKSYQPPPPQKRKKYHNYYKDQTNVNVLKD